MNKGEIFLGVDRNNTHHPIVFLEELNNYSFRAAIISTEPTGNNIPMKSTHFYPVGGIYTLGYGMTSKPHSYLITDMSFIKMNDWVNSTVVGKLTPTGIVFVEANIPKDPTLMIARMQEFGKCNP